MLKYWIALQKIKGINTPGARAFIESLADISVVFEKKGPAFTGDGAKIAAQARSFSGWDRIEKELELIEKHGVRVVTIKDALYPPLLKEIYDPPLLLYAKGFFPSGASPHLAVVGTRRASPYALDMSEKISFDLARCGITVVSGLARGCDSAAHRGALKAADGKTVAVLGCGVDVVYPRENKRLYEEIAEKGLLISEFPMGTPPLAKNFPVRNRIIGGLSLGVCVVEAPEKSGAMMTARLALENFRDIFALPGRVKSGTKSGTNKLIKEGATLVEDALDILKTVFPERSFDIPGGPGTEKTPENKEESLIAAILGDDPLHIDAIAKKSGMPVEKVSSLLLSMELKGIIEQRPGKLFTKKV